MSSSTFQIGLEAGAAVGEAEKDAVGGGELDQLGGADFEFVEFGADELRQLDEHLICGTLDQGAKCAPLAGGGLRAQVMGTAASELLLAAVNFGDEDGLGVFWEEVCQVERCAPLAPGQYAKLAAAEVDVLPVIQRDMPRTFPGHPVFSGEHGACGQAALLRILTAYAHYVSGAGPEVAPRRADHSAFRRTPTYRTCRALTSWSRCCTSTSTATRCAPFACCGG